MNQRQTLNVGDIVARRSYQEDILFKVVNINGETVTLKGLFYRIQADAPKEDLILQSQHRITQHSVTMDRVISEKVRTIKKLDNSRSARGAYKSSGSRKRGTSNKFPKPGRILHIDGDKSYVELCMEQYNKFDLDVVPKYISEKEQPLAIYTLLQQYNPDILVLTGHDGVIRNGKETKQVDYSNINNYRNSKYFIDSVRQARKYEKDLDTLIIFAGACQSMYGDIINAGANYASSPSRVLIHALDPVFICQKLAFASAGEMVSPIEVINTTITGAKGIGGIQTRGKYREGFPIETYED